MWYKYAKFGFGKSQNFFSDFLILVMTEEVKKDTKISLFSGGGEEGGPSKLGQFLFSFSWLSLGKASSLKLLNFFQNLVRFSPSQSVNTK